MTPPRSSDSRFALLEADVKRVDAKVIMLEAGQLSQTSVTVSNHKENRDSIHTLNDNQQTIINQQGILQQDVTRLKTQMDMVIGSDHGKPGRLDDIQNSIKNAVKEFKDGTDKMMEEVRSTGKKQTEQNWLYELGKLLALGVVAAAAAHWGKS